MQRTLFASIPWDLFYAVSASRDLLEINRLDVVLILGHVPMVQFVMGMRSVSNDAGSQGISVG